MDSIIFSKIVATPTLASWSQAYNAGKLFAVLSLDKTQDAPPEIESLNILGKNLLERLEQEFFVIEEKNLETVKQAILTTFSAEVKGVNISFAAGTLVNNILYIFCLGKSKVFIKRDGNFGLALESDSKNISTSSGFLKEGDLIVLATEAFSQIITQDDLDASLNNLEPSEIAETLAPKVHKAEDGKISAIILKYQNPVQEEIIDEGITEPEEEKQNQIQEEVAPTPIPNQFFAFVKSFLKKPNFAFRLNKKIFLMSAIVIVGVIIFSVVLAIREQNNAKIKALFAEVYPQAQKKYEEGQGLIDLNKTYARDSLENAQKILNDNKNNFPKGSSESKQIEDLLAKIEEGLTQVSPVDKSGLDRSKLTITVQNGSGTEGAAGKAANILKDLGYNVPSTENADNYSYKGITIKVKKENSSFLSLLEKDLSKDYTVNSATSDLKDAVSTQAIIIVGK